MPFSCKCSFSSFFSAVPTVCPWIWDPSERETDLPLDKVIHYAASSRPPGSRCSYWGLPSTSERGLLGWQITKHLSVLHRALGVFLSVGQRYPPQFPVRLGRSGGQHLELSFEVLSLWLVQPKMQAMRGRDQECQDAPDFLSVFTRIGEPSGNITRLSHLAVL